jgi:hypothetical protein
VFLEVCSCQRGKPYEARNNAWVRLRPTTNVERQILMAHFEHAVDLSGVLLSAAMEKEYTLTFKLLAQLSRTVEQHGVNDLGTLFEAVEKVGQLLEIFTLIRAIKAILGVGFCGRTISEHWLRLLEVSRCFLWLQS